MLRIISNIDRWLSLNIFIFSHIVFVDFLIFFSSSESIFIHNYTAWIWWWKSKWLRMLLIIRNRWKEREEKWKHFQILDKYQSEKETNYSCFWFRCSKIAIESTTTITISLFCDPKYDFHLLHLSLIKLHQIPNFVFHLFDFEFKDRN